MTQKKKVALKIKSRKNLIKKSLSKLDFNRVRINGLDLNKFPHVYFGEGRVETVRPRFRFNVSPFLTDTEEILAWERTNAMYEDGDLN